MQLEDCYETKDKIYMCLELHSKITLYEYIQMTKDYLDQHKARSLAQKIGEALDYLHDNGIILTNLDATGILMSEITKGYELNVVPRISRLNKAVVKGANDCEYCIGMEGDIRFRAPEVVSGLNYHQPADCWSYGVILYYILTAELPFDNKPQRDSAALAGKFV